MLYTFGAILFASVCSAIAFAGLSLGPVVIINSGSTNTPGFTIVVGFKGDVAITINPRGPNQQRANARQKHGQIPPVLAQRFYSDLEAARPFSALPRPWCMKSVSFGTRLTISFQGDETPDLKCGDDHNAKLSALNRDAKQIITLLHPL
jgi:hypothetical protein